MVPVGYSPVIGASPHSSLTTPWMDSDSMGLGLEGSVGTPIEHSNPLSMTSTMTELSMNDLIHTMGGTPALSVSSVADASVVVPNLEDEFDPLAVNHDTSWIVGTPAFLPETEEIMKHEMRDPFINQNAIIQSREWVDISTS